MEEIIELIFYGKIEGLNLQFLKEYLTTAKNTTLNGESVQLGSAYDLVDTLKQNREYIDLSFGLDSLDFNGSLIPKVYCEFGLSENGNAEVLFFFGIKDAPGEGLIEKLLFTRKWANEFKEENALETFVCQLDNGNEDEYYFNDVALGPLFPDWKNIS